MMMWRLVLSDWIKSNLYVHVKFDLIKLLTFSIKCNLIQMISAEAPVLFAKAAEIFISELSLRAWIHTEDNKRRTLQVIHL